MVPRCSLVVSVAYFIFAIGLPPHLLTAKECPQFPQDPEVWVNSRPVNVHQLRGKTGVLIFLEAGIDVRVSVAAWQGHNSFNQNAVEENKPFTFIAVVSGRSPEEVRLYANTVDASFPVFADVDRSFETACGVPEITTKHREEIVVIEKTGELQPMDSDRFIDFFFSLEVDDSSWKLRPEDVPESLHELWRKVELGFFDGLSPALKRSRVSKKADVQNAAKKLQELVQAAIDDELAAVKAVRDIGEPWEAYEMCRVMTDRFKGFDLPVELNEIKKELAKLPEVKGGTAGWKTIDSARKNLKEGRSITKNTVTQLEKLVSDFPETDLSRAASRILEKAKQSQ